MCGYLYLVATLLHFFQNVFHKIVDGYLNWIYFISFLDNTENTHSQILINLRHIYAFAIVTT